MRYLVPVLASASVLISTANADAAVTTYVDRATFLAAVTPTQSIDFAGITGPGGYTLVQGQTIGGVTFSDTSGSLGVIDPAFAPGFYDWASGASLLGYYYGDSIVAALPSFTHAVGADVMVAEFSQGGVPYAFTATVTLSDSSMVALPIVTLPRPGRAFVGFTSDLPITAIQFQTPDDQALGLYPLPMIDNFVYQATACASDVDGDGVCDPVDNCLHVPNPSQADSNNNGLGDACNPVCVTIQRGVNGTVADTYIVNTPSDLNSNFGPRTTMLSDATPRDALIRFDLSFIPATATINSATAKVGERNTGAATVRVHRITAPWAEGTVTWASFGGAFDPANAATFANGGLAFNGAASFDLTALVQSWVNGTKANNGVLLEETGAPRTTYQSSEAAVTAQHPSLAVCYLVPG